MQEGPCRRCAACVCVCSPCVLGVCVFNVGVCVYLILLIDLLYTFVQQVFPTLHRLQRTIHSLTSVCFCWYRQMVNIIHMCLCIAVILMFSRSLSSSLCSHPLHPLSHVLPLPTPTTTRHTPLHSPNLLVVSVAKTSSKTNARPIPPTPPCRLLESQ